MCAQTGGGAAGGRLRYDNRAHTLARAKRRATGTGVSGAPAATRRAYIKNCLGLHMNSNLRAQELDLILGGHDHGVATILYTKFSISMPTSTWVSGPRDTVVFLRR